HGRRASDVRANGVRPCARVRLPAEPAASCDGVSPGPAGGGRHASMLKNLTMAARLMRDFKTFLQQPLTLEEAGRILRERLARRDEAFLDIVARAVFGNARRPYLRLLNQARIRYGHIEGWMSRGSVEGALAEFYEAGVYVTLDEFKGRRPICRPGLELTVRAHDFDNPFVTAHYEGGSGGSRSAGTRTRVDLALLAHEAAAQLVF